MLLTLLVIIYRNSGPLAARRHIIYSQAVKTLVSVRHRSARARVLSEADLRRRLGLLAIAVYRGLVSEIPSRKEVRHTLGGEGVDASQGKNSAAEVDAFLQDVAESTGLVSIHPRSASSEDDVVSFMHHSFLEYYAAFGFLSEPNFKEAAPAVALSPRWREVITLMFGVLGEQSDVTDFLSEIAGDRNAADKITASRLSLALDCALECDVPPDRSQALIAKLVTETLSSGAGNAVADVRILLARKVQELLQNTGSEVVKRKLIEGIEAAEPRIAAAHIDFVARMPQVVNDDPRFNEAVTSAFVRTESSVRTACISAVQAHHALRQQKNLEQVRLSLKRGPIFEQLAALQLLDSQPSLISEFSDEVLDLLESSNRLISTTASRCVLIGGIFAKDQYKNRELLSRTLAIFTQSNRLRKDLDQYIEFPTERLEELIYSTAIEDQRLGIRCLVALRREPAAIHDYLFSVLRKSNSHEVRTVCLEALAADARVIRVASFADTDLVCRFTRDKHIDVRTSAIKALRHFPTIDFVKAALKERYEALRSHGSELERAETIRSLSAHGAGDKETRQFLQNELVRALRRADGWGQRRKAIVTRLLYACEQLGGIVSPLGATLIYDAASDFRTPTDVRTLAIRTFGRTASATLENGERILKFLGRAKRAERLASYKAAGAYIEKCRGNVTTVRTVKPVLERLQKALVAKWDMDRKGLRDRIDVSGLRDIRSALVALEEIVTNYEEFSARMKTGRIERQSGFDFPQ